MPRLHVQYQLDVLKPHQPNSDILARSLIELKGVNYVRIKVDEIDQKTTSLFIRVGGTDEISLEKVTDALNQLNCSLHSVDQVIIQKEE
ncbi:MAG: DUF211 domain-containing protein [Promethearchaeia archaeon]